MAGGDRKLIGMMLVMLLALVACGGEPQATPPSTPQPEAAALAVQMLYPAEGVEVAKGQAIRFTVKVADAAGTPREDAVVQVTVYDASGEALGTLPTERGSEGVYRSILWAVPNARAAGSWRVETVAEAANARGALDSSFLVKNSTSDDFREEYGFWIDAPTLNNIAPMVMLEQGDASAGMIRWGGMLPGMHILHDNWIDLHWRSGAFPLETPEQVSEFIMDELGNVNMSPLRALGPFEQVEWKGWQAWRVGARSRVKQEQVEWMVFYAPEVDKTYAIGTSVVMPPAGIDPHAALRDSFAVFPEVQAAGVAPEPLPRLLPAPELISPAMGTSYIGTDEPIVLEWAPLKELAEDEYYEVAVRYAYIEDTPTVRFQTRDTQLTLPDSLYQTPNCSYFNWQVTLKRELGTYQNGEVRGEELSYRSFLWYVEWKYPVGERPFSPVCPNHQI